MQRSYADCGFHIVSIFGLTGNLFLQTPVGGSATMTLQTFIVRLNWRQIVMHFIATWFFMYSFQTLSFLHNLKLTDLVRQSKESEIIKALHNSGISVSETLYFTLWIHLGKTIGIVTAFVLSLILSIERKWFWVNSFIVLFLAYGLSWFSSLGWRYLNKIFLTPGQIFKNTLLEFLTNGLILLMLGLLTFFVAKSNKFIEKGGAAIS